jgi:anti-sigma factor RsiW
MDHEEAIKIRAAERYMLGELSPGERDDFEAHFFECAICGAEVRSADLFIENLRAVLAEEAVEPKRKQESWLKQLLAGWLGWSGMGAWRPAPAFAAVAALVVVVSAESFLLWHARGCRRPRPRAWWRRPCCAPKLAASRCGSLENEAPPCC